ncbi:5'-methylthioadenosine/adenosylhomocysteine nucleosidase [Ancylobacter sp. TS-1]|uniref:5'-methylthioadenosine/adenosylhomocysteine nucleosidase n=1 Tax=Ancylobacter sp. TS-1 TaxID=1850374 RepID=UPI001265B76B|nr:5'-methylthioadenosine/adenosylhomocysteine nucleosidase [Ancylobacter sp. TS-1]QFR35023.1 5'-methylthioadenosine/adenosylhomocysteine nucleosidase [Ancylobacter sp. TS-1]
MGPVGILCAIPQEFAFLADNLVHPEISERAGMTFHAGRLDGHPVVLARAGMGKVNAAIAATLLIERFGCRVLLFSGIAGGLDPELAVGDVVIAEDVVQHDAGYTSEEGFVVYQAGHLPFFSPYEGLGHAADGALMERVRAALADLTLAPLSAGSGDAPRLHYGRVLTGDQFVNSETLRERLFREFGGAAVEMEGAAMAQACHAFGVPWLVVRALSDLAGSQSHFDFRLFIDEVSLSSALIVRRLLPVL